MSKHESRKCQKTYGEEFKRGSRGEGRIEKELDDIISIVNPFPPTKERESGVKGRDDGLKQYDLRGSKEGAEGYSGSSSYSSSSAGSPFTPADYRALAIGGAVCLAVLFLFITGISILRSSRTKFGPIVNGVPLALAGVPVYSLQCGETSDIQIPAATRSAVLLVPPCKCSDLSELNYDCAGWVRIMEPSSHWQMNMRNLDGSGVNECSVFMEYKRGRGPQGVAPNTPIKIAGCLGPNNNQAATLQTKDNPAGEHLLIPDRFTIQNSRNSPIRVSIEFP